MRETSRQNNITALILGFVLLAMAGAKEWLLDLWHTSPGFGRWAVAAIVSLVIGFALIWAVAPIVYAWGSWLFAACGI
jgi:hypothetical protein